MASYTPEQRGRNQTTVLMGSATVLVALLVGAAAGVIPFSGLGYGFIGVTVVGGIFWWLFASKRAGDINDTWVEWNFNDPIRKVLARESKQELPHHPLSINDDPDLAAGQRNRLPGSGIDPTEK